MVQFVVINVDTSALFAPATRAFGNLGVVGYGTSGSLTVAQVFETQSAVETEYGAGSAIAEATNIAFQNGAKKIYCARATHTAATEQTDTGDGSQVVFQLDVSTDGYPQQGSLVVNVSAVDLVEGTDYNVDWGNGQVIFVTAPAGAAPITFNFDGITAANFVIALALLEVKDVQIVVGAMTYEPAHIEDIKDHVLTASGSGKERIGIAMLPYGNSDGLVNSIQIVGTGGSITNQERMVCFGSASFDDIAAACAGVIASFEPWISVILKPVAGTVKQRELTSTEETALIALQVNPVIDVDVITGSGLYTAEGFNLSGDASRSYVDITRVIDDITFRLKAGLTSPATIGNLKINEVGLRALRSQVRAIMAPRVKAGEIDSFAVDIPLLALVSIPSAGRSPEQTAELNTAKAARTVTVDVSIEYSGAIHGLTVNLKFV